MRMAFITSVDASVSVNAALQHARNSGTGGQAGHHVADEAVPDESRKLGIVTCLGAAFCVELRPLQARNDPRRASEGSQHRVTHAADEGQRQEGGERLLKTGRQRSIASRCALARETRTSACWWPRCTQLNALASLLLPSAYLCAG